MSRLGGNLPQHHLQRGLPVGDQMEWGEAAGGGAGGREHTGALKGGGLFYGRAGRAGASYYCMPLPACTASVIAID